MFKLGDKVKFTKVLKKKKYKYIELERSGEGIVVGIRTVAEGHWESDYEYSRSNNYYVNDKSIVVVLVATNLKSFEKVEKINLVKIE